MPETPVHVPVLLGEVVQGLVPEGWDRNKDSFWLDATLGLGGHAAALLEAAGPKARLLGLDKDAQARRIAAGNLKALGDRISIHAGGFEGMLEPAKIFLGSAAGFDGILMDIGVSSLQLDRPERGFSFSKDGPLDMRMDQSAGEPASEWLQRQDAESLAKVIWEFGEEPKSRAYARSILRALPITTTAQLAEAVLRAAGPRKQGAVHPATKVFQAIRIAVNRELEALDLALPQAVSLLRSGGRLGVISFHSLEDRRVKEYFRRESTDCLCPPKIPVCQCGHKAGLKLVSRKALVPGEAEIEKNPRSRSAKLRLAEKL